MSNSNINRKLLVSTFVLGGVLTANLVLNTNINADSVTVKNSSATSSSIVKKTESSSSSNTYTLKSSKMTSPNGKIQSTSGLSQENSSVSSQSSSKENTDSHSNILKENVSSESKVTGLSSSQLSQSSENENNSSSESRAMSKLSEVQKNNLSVQNSASSVNVNKEAREASVNKDEYSNRDFIYLNDVNNVTSDGTFAPVYPWKETGHRWEKDMDYVMVAYKDKWGKNNDVMTGLPGTTYGYGNQTSVDKFETSPYVTIKAPTGYKFDVAYSESFDVDKSHYFDFVSDTEVHFNWQQYAAERGHGGTFELFLYNAKTGHSLPVNKQDGIQIHWISNKNSHPIANYPFIPIEDLPSLAQTQQPSKVYYKVYVPKDYKIDNKTTSQYTADHNKANEGNYSLFYIPGYTGANDPNTYTWAYIKPDWMPKNYLDQGTLNIVGWVDPDSSNQGNNPEWIPMTDKAAELSGLQSNGNITVNYIDKTTGEVIKSEKISGKVGSESDYSTANEIKGLEDKGYELVSNGYSNGTKFENNDQSFNVELKHKIEDYSNSSNPLKLDLSKQVTNTINYQYEDGSQAAPSVTQTVTFVRTAEKDMVTGNISYGSWTANTTKFDSVKSPQIDGYVPNQKNSNVIEVNENSLNTTQTITYSKVKSENTNENKPADKPENDNTNESKPADKPANNNTSESKPADKPVNNNTSESKLADKPVNNNTSKNTTDTHLSYNEINTLSYVEQKGSVNNSSNEKISNSEKNALPQAGEISSKHTLLGTIALAFSGILAMLGLSKKEKNNK